MLSLTVAWRVRGGFIEAPTLRRRERRVDASGKIIVHDRHHRNRPADRLVSKISDHRLPSVLPATLGQVSLPVPVVDDRHHRGRLDATSRRLALSVDLKIDHPVLLLVSRLLLLGSGCGSRVVELVVVRRAPDGAAAGPCRDEVLGERVGMRSWIIRSC